MEYRNQLGLYEDRAPVTATRHTTSNWHGLPGDTSPDRGTEILSFDTGLFFERDSKKGNLQTLEPRLFYLYVPYVKQQGFPDFDTAPFTFGFSQLFHYNRFTGADRQSDANQLTLALTTRSINQLTGRELWSLSFGQILYFENQRVLSVDGKPLLSEDSSPFIAEFIDAPDQPTQRPQSAPSGTGRTTNLMSPCWVRPIPRAAVCVSAPNTVTGAIAWTSLIFATTSR